MEIKKVFIGNGEEAFIEEGFTSGFNIIHSYNNNKGKTIVMQAIIYALGGEAMFPNSFQYKDYYYIIEINHNNKGFTICRKNNSFIIKTETGFNIFESSAEYRYFFDKVIYQLPKIVKDGKMKTVDIALLSELFFLSQANRNTSNIINYGYYKKQDFVNVLYALVGIVPFEDDVDIDTIKAKIKSLKQEQKELKKQNSILSSVSKGMEITSLEVNRTQYERKLEKIEELKNKISNLINERNRLTNGKIKDEMLVKELNSLNRKLPSGELCCINCGSTNIGYKTPNSDCIFDVSDVQTRRNILDSLNSQIEMAIEEIEKTTLKIEKLQIELQALLKEENIDLATLLLFKPEAVKALNADTRLAEINKELIKYENKLKVNTSDTEEIKLAIKELTQNIISEMQSFYFAVEPNGNSIFDEIYTSITSPYSGSEETEFYLAKLYTFAKLIGHDFPIIVDGFREGEIDSEGEKTILMKFKDIPNQIIFTATLKNEESNHYKMYNFINAIDYTSFEDSHILNIRYVEQFKNKLLELGIKL